MKFDPNIIDELFLKHDKNRKYQNVDDQEYTWESGARFIWAQVSTQEDTIYFSVTVDGETIENWDSYLNDENLSYLENTVEVYFKLLKVIYIASVKKRFPFARRRRTVALVKVGKNYYPLTPETARGELTTPFNEALAEKIKPMTATGQ